MMKQWFDDIQETLEQIEVAYAEGSAQEKKGWCQQVQAIKQSCEDFVEAWIEIEERMAKLMNQYPELQQEESENEEWEEEFWLQETAVRQFRQGQGYYDLTMFQEAQKRFREVIQEEPDFQLGRLYFGLSLFQSGQWEEAVKQFQLVISTTDQEPFLAFAHHMLGCCWVRLGKDLQAIECFSRSLSLNSEQADAWFNLGTCYYRLHDYEEAISCFYRALAINEQDWESMYYLSNCYRHVQQWSRVSFWRFASYEKIQHPQVTYSIAQDFEEMGNAAKAIEWYEKLLVHPDYQSVAYQGIGWNYWCLNQPLQAKLWIKKGLSLQPQNPDLLFTYVWIQLVEGEMDSVRKVMIHLPEYLKDEPLWWAMSSRIFIQLGNLDGAIEMAEQLIQLPTDSLQALGYYQKGLAMLELGDTQEAILQFRQAQQRRSQWKDPIFYEGVCHMMEGQTDQSTQCWEKIKEE